MKGPLAATIMAGAKFDAADLKKPLFIVVTADEEISGVGVRAKLQKSPSSSRRNALKHGVIAEPTRLLARLTRTKVAGELS